MVGLTGAEAWRTTVAGRAESGLALTADLRVSAASSFLYVGHCQPSVKLKSGCLSDSNYRSEATLHLSRWGFISQGSARTV